MSIKYMSIHHGSIKKAVTKANIGCWYSSPSKRRNNFNQWASNIPTLSARSLLLIF